MTKSARSPFAAALYELLHATGTQSEWAKRLGVSPGSVSQWVNDETVPRPHRLRLLIRQLRGTEPRSPEEREARASFDKILEQRGPRVLPQGSRIRRSLGYYLLDEYRQSFLQALATLSPRAAEQLLKAGISAVPALRSSRASVFDSEEACEDMVRFVRGGGGEVPGPAEPARPAVDSAQRKRQAALFGRPDKEVPAAPPRPVPVTVPA